MAGHGRIYQRGERFFIAYSYGGREYRESTRSRDPAVAQRLLDDRLSRLAPVAVPSAHDRLTFDALAQGYLEDYRLRQFRTLSTARLRVANLKGFFSGTSAQAIGAGHIREYQACRRRAGVSAATVNRETAALHRMFRLALINGRINHVPTFPPRLRESPPRQGFFEHDEYVRIRVHLPEPYQDVLDFAYYSGWRRREITDLCWREVDLAGGVIRLDPARSKNGFGRILPITPPLCRVLLRRRERCPPDAVQVFQRDSVTIRTWRTAWQHACTAAKLSGKHLHDCRRTAARNLIRAGVPERIAMSLLGHLTRSVFDRYNIVSERDLLEAGQRLTTYLGAQA